MEVLGMPKIILMLVAVVSGCAAGQAFQGATIKGTVTDPSNSVVASAEVDLTSLGLVSSRQTRTGSDGSFAIYNLPESRYTLKVWAPGFQSYVADVDIQAGLAVSLSVRLELAGQQTRVTVVDVEQETLVANTMASDIVGRQRLASLPMLSPDSGLNDAIVYTTSGIAADSNGFFHPMGDHAQVSYVIDGQPIPDQRNKVFSTSIPANAIQSMEVISGSPAAEFGDKTSLIVSAATRSGLGQKPSGSLAAHYGSFGTVGEEATLSLGGPRWGNFLVGNAERTGRFLDTPEFWPMHDVGNTGVLFDRADFQPGGRDALHLNVMAARNWFQTPNTYVQPRQDQRQKVVSLNVAPGYQRTIDGRSFYSINAYLRRDNVDYYPSRNALDDLPATLGQHRTLTNFGLRSDWSAARGRHLWKAGVNAMQTRLNELFSLGVTDPLYNSPCLDEASRTPVAGFTSAAECPTSGFRPNPDFLSSLVPYDLTRGGSLYRFSGRANITQVALYGQDSITLGNLTLSIGLRLDLYHGLTEGGGFEPRGAFAYLIKTTGTVVRGGYSHTIETPTNENLV